MDGLVCAPNMNYRIEHVLYRNDVTKRAFYKVKNLELGMFYGLKVIEIDDAQLLKQVKNEVTALNRLPFGMAPKCLQYWVQGKQHYLLLDWIEGKPLSGLYQRPPQTVMEQEQRLLVAQKLAQKVADIHRVRMLHRDIKPDNVIVRLQGNNVQDVLLIDFGLANQQRALEEGTPFYQAPEQSLSRHVRLTESVDVFSVCQTIHFLMTGQPLTLTPNFMNDDWAQPIAELLLASGLSKSLSALLVKGLSFDPNKRLKQSLTLNRDLYNLLRSSKTGKY
ncbi:serine/threonine protein kinase [Shewanella fodinae]|jgi:serine/threonine-protein kinase|uniref:serine/threonine protein kinase n=2 Tax=Shewanella fodinae TaxID=552357 RepID=UPI001673B1C1|nr:protein kinase [Shewanella fodinae]MCL2908236.1 protein kinase [Shewanella fodinae]GGZ14472.1 hypothetical protein GCM10007169_33670 [Shewanella fodinae]